MPGHLGHLYVDPNVSVSVHEPFDEIRIRFNPVRLVLSPANAQKLAMDLLNACIQCYRQREPKAGAKESS